MSRMRIIRANAPKLLDATKTALKHLLRQDPHPLAQEEEKRQRVMAELRMAIEAAEPPKFDEAISSIRLQMTGPTWKKLSDILQKRACQNADDRAVLEAVEEGFRETKQRVYITLALNHVILRRLCFVLEHTKSASHDKPFRRLAVQIKEEGLTKNPMEILAEMGL
jgi:hypothetical protein